MGTLFLEKHFSPLDILVKNFFQAEQEEFTTPNNRIINHPVDIYEDKTGLFFDIACTGLTKKQIKVDIEDDILRVSYTKKDDKEEVVLKKAKNLPSLDRALKDKMIIMTTKL